LALNFGSPKSNGALLFGVTGWQVKIEPAIWVCESLP
jgi:hypothetical protein